MKKKNEYTISIIVAVLLILFGSFYYFSELANSIISMLFISLGIALVVIQTLRFNKFGAGVNQDERTRKISTRSISYSWLISFISINVLIWFDIFSLVKLDLIQALSIINFIMIISAVLFKLLLNNKNI